MCRGDSVSSSTVPGTRTRNPSAARAWRILKDTVYAAPHRTRSIIDHVPSLNPADDAPYDNVRLAGAWRHLLRAADELGSADTYRFDLVNIARQVLSNHAAVLQRKVVEAHRSGAAEAFRAAADHFLELMRDMDALLATRPESQAVPALYFTPTL